MDHLIKSYGGTLQNLLVDEARATQLKKDSQGFPAITLSQRQLCDLELLMNGAFSPLRGFMARETYESVLENMRLPGGLLWPMPITLDVPDAIADKLDAGSYLGLNDSEGFMLAVLRVADKWKPDKKREAQLVYGTDSLNHPGVRFLFEQAHENYVGGDVEGIQLPMHHDFETLRDTPEELRHLFEKHGWRRVVAFNTSKPMHRLHRDITLRAAKEAQANILLHPAVGMTKPGDLHYYARVHCYQAIRRYYPHNLAMLSLLPMAVRMAGPREAILNAIVRQNYGCSHIIIGPEHAAPPEVRAGGERFYPRYAAQELLARHQGELGIRMIPVREMQYVPGEDQFLPVEKIEKEGKKAVLFTEKELYSHLSHDQEIPAWFSFPDVLAELRKVCPPRSRQGITLFFTGLSGSGKSTLAKILYAKFIEAGGRPVTLLDGDVVRHNLSNELGFSKQHRDLNIRRIGFVASEITKNGGIAICAPIAPYHSTRRAVRELIEQHGAFIEIHVATPLEVCEARDRKGLYAKARKGLIPEFTGISDPYETPQNPELRIDTATMSPMEAAQEVFLYLLREGYIDADGDYRQ
ncbi:MAG: bifunctional sulfate adenylyltransferase/adenylylsulfate kinase [Sulfuricaulis sp.]|uniref:bifunctional sulfate adenylyltransferase/adenylylsulfate kinase n=1 Tax=Sulfuricaulis sp. TaxID=2003553 RepID=UPI0025E4E081|nr:bifunctional sulfate adenylyltransferase/adenylylsulfate kinase [Sulfuricaulis sp.]MCR4347328.1 bifunctional sulfate adenylyltransferase/adenylylsulfate kinase [Sulfuricaulis sp.]